MTIVQCFIFQISLDNLFLAFNSQIVYQLLLIQSNRVIEFQSIRSVIQEKSSYYQFMAEFQIYSSPGSLHKGSPQQRQNRQLSPSRFDVDFYRRKAERLEEELLTLSDELNKARLRLRRAEDFQIKYDLLFKQKSSLEENMIKKDKELFELRSKNEQLNLKVSEKGAKTTENHYEKERLLKEIQIWKEKAIEADQRCKLTVAEQHDRASERIQKELDIMKRNFQEAEKEYKFQISRLKKQVQEKSTVDTTVFDRHDKIKKEKEHEINRLQKIVQKNREDYLQMVDQKNNEIMRQKDKFQQILNDQLGNLQKNINHQDEKFKLQLGGLRKVIDLKNQEINNLQNQLKIALEQSAKERQEFNNQIQLLKSKIYERQRQNEEELFNMKERLTSLHAIDIEAFHKHYDDLIEGLKDERRYLQGLLKQKDGKLEFERKEFQRSQQELTNIIKDRQRTISECKQKLNSTGQSSSSEINNLQQILNKYANQKQILSNQYQANIAFLNQQISKLTASNQLKNNQIRELHQYNALLKKEHFEQIKQLETKWKQERRQRENERQKQRDLREKVQEQSRQKEKTWKNRQRQLERDIQKQKRQKNKWAISNERLQKQVERLYKQNNELEEKCKNEESKNQKTIIGGGGTKRQLANELERQKADFQLIKKMEIDQVKKKYQLQLTRMNNLNQKIQNQLVVKKIDFENLENEFKKISTQYRNTEKISKQKLIDYNKKMSALNSQILLTQNLYQSLIGAKSKVIKKDNI